MLRVHSQLEGVPNTLAPGPTWKVQQCCYNHTLLVDGNDVKVIKCRHKNFPLY